MLSSVEWLARGSSRVGVLRVHPCGGYGSPYSWACTIAIDGDRATLYGVTRSPTMAEARHIKRALIYVGAARSEWERREGLAVRTVLHRKAGTINSAQRSNAHAV